MSGFNRSSDFSAARCHILQVISPLFRCLAKSIDKDGGRGIEIAGRLGYDDVNECFCRREVVHEVNRHATILMLRNRHATTTISMSTSPYVTLLHTGPCCFTLPSIAEHTLIHQPCTAGAGQAGRERGPERRRCHLPSRAADSNAGHWAARRPLTAAGGAPWCGSQTCDVGWPVRCRHCLIFESADNQRTAGRPLAAAATVSQWVLTLVNATKGQYLFHKSQTNYMLTTSEPSRACEVLRPLLVRA